MLIIIVFLYTSVAKPNKFNGQGYWSQYSFVDDSASSIIDFDLCSPNVLGYSSWEQYETNLPYPLNICDKSSAMISCDGGKTFKCIFESLGDTSEATLNQPYLVSQMSIIDSMNIILRLYCHASDSFPHLYAKTTNGGREWNIRPWTNQLGANINTVSGLDMNSAEYGVGWNLLYISFVDDSTNTITTFQDLGTILYGEGKKLRAVQRLSPNSCKALAINFDSLKSDLFVTKPDFTPSIIHYTDGI